MSGFPRLTVLGWKATEEGRAWTIGAWRLCHPTGAEGIWGGVGGGGAGEVTWVLYTLSLGASEVAHWWLLISFWELRGIRNGMRE